MDTTSLSSWNIWGR